MNENELAVLLEIRNWIRASSYMSVKQLLETALPDTKSRMTYQMMDGSLTSEQIRLACKVSPNTIVTLSQRWTSLGLMELGSDKRRKRIFDLADFGLLAALIEE